MTNTQNTIDYIELTARFGLPDTDQSALLAWTGEDADHEWTIAEADELAEIWAADVDRIELSA